ncbi:AaceriAGR102Cp [[Ashbya] aceris (nom. inval.)]|nr:AaceriAGR102Cp [[Ashbya] aceris (nom. inval.)]
MALAISSEDTQVLLKDKNVLHESNVDKYRTAGQITQTALRFLTGLINDSYHHRSRATPLTVAELCMLTDSFVERCVRQAFANKANERGIAHPTTIDVDEITQGWAPEMDDATNMERWNQDRRASAGNCQGARSAISGFLHEGDVVKLTVGCHIDGYTSQVSHTMVVYPTVQREEDQALVPAGPLLGAKADAVAAATIAKESVTSLLACAQATEKLPAAFGERQVTGTLIRRVVDAVARSYNCAVVPGSRVRRVRRFLAGQNEGVVAERDIKGVHWTEAHQEAALLAASVETTDVARVDASNKSANDSAVATDDFVVLSGEAYLIDLKLAPLKDMPRGLLTLQTVDHFSGKSHRKDELLARASLICRDFAKQHVLKLKSSRQLLHKLDSKGVYPTKLSHLSAAFPLDPESPDWDAVSKELKHLRLGLAEVTNNYLANEKPVQLCRLVPWDVILKAVNPTGKHGIDASNPTLPGYEIPLPQLGISSLRLKSLLKDSLPVPVARESITVLLCPPEVTNTGRPELLKLTGGPTTTPSWVHSDYELNVSDPVVQGILQLAELSKDKRFGLAVRETQPWKQKIPSAAAVSSADVEMA